MAKALTIIAVIVIVIAIAYIFKELAAYEQAKANQPPGISTPFGGITL